MVPWKILLVDDEPELLKIYRFILEGMGHVVVACQDSEEALQCFHDEKGEFDMLLTDYRMPVLNGLQLAQILRLINPSLPVMIITAARSYLHDHLLDVSNLICLPKPVRYGALEEHICSLQTEVRLAA